MKSNDLAKNTAFLSLILRLFSLLLAMGALFVPFATGLKSAVDSDSGTVITNYGPAFSFLFGGVISAGRLRYSTNGVSVLGTISYILSVLSFLGLAVFFLLRREKKAKLFILGAMVMSLVSAILILSSHASMATLLADSILGKHSESVAATLLRNSTLEFGFWGIALFGFISVIFLAASLVFDGTVDEVMAKIGHR